MIEETEQRSMVIITLSLFISLGLGGVLTMAGGEFGM